MATFRWNFALADCAVFKSKFSHDFAVTLTLESISLSKSSRSRSRSLSISVFYQSGTLVRLLFQVSRRHVVSRQTLAVRRAQVDCSASHLWVLTQASFLRFVAPVFFFFREV